MKRVVLCVAALLIGVGVLTGCETTTRSSAERAALHRRIIENDMKLLVEDWDLLWMNERPTRLSRWVER
jgi:hypothetical protein